MPKVVLTYEDNESLTIEEIVRYAKKVHGEKTSVEVSPNSVAPHDQIYWALQQIITRRQIELIYDRDITYSKSMPILRAETLDKLSTILDQVIYDNEVKLEVT